MEPMLELVSIARCKVMDCCIGLPATMMSESAINYSDSNHAAGGEAEVWITTRKRFSIWFVLLAELAEHSTTFSPPAFHRQTRAFLWHPSPSRRRASKFRLNGRRNADPKSRWLLLLLAVEAVASAASACANCRAADKKCPILGWDCDRQAVEKRVVWPTMLWAGRRKWIKAKSFRKDSLGMASSSPAGCCPAATQKTSFGATKPSRKIDQSTSHFQLPASSAPDTLHTTPTFQLRRRIFDKL